MIPVLIVPCISRFDLLEGMLASIDHPIGRIVVVENSCSGWCSTHHELPISYIRPIQGLGYGGGINEGIRQTCEEPWWMFANADITWRPGALSEIATRMDGHLAARFIDHGFQYGALNRAVVRQIGLIDDWDFYPIYFDDNDYHRRLELAGIEVQNFIAEDQPEGFSTVIRSSKEHEQANNKSFVDNRERYVRKWGGMPEHETFTSPWNSGLPLWYTKPDIDGRAHRQW